MFERKRYQFGYVRQKPRKTGSHVWVWEYRDGSGSHSVIRVSIPIENSPLYRSKNPHP
jgi:hypothetical protein